MLKSGETAHIDLLDVVCKKIEFSETGGSVGLSTAENMKRVQRQINFSDGWEGTEDKRRDGCEPVVDQKKCFESGEPIKSPGVDMGDVIPG